MIDWEGGDSERERERRRRLGTGRKRRKLWQSLANVVSNLL